MFRQLCKKRKWVKYAQRDNFARSDPITQRNFGTLLYKI